MLSVLNATKVLQFNQSKLRRILKHPLSTLEQSTEQMSSYEEEPCAPVLLIQKILMKATQPSPLKPIYSMEELQLAALNLSQYLAAEASNDKPSPTTISNDKFKNIPPPSLITGINQAVSELPTPNSECSVKSMFSDSNTNTNTNTNTNKSNTKKKKDTGEQLPSNPIVQQIVEMGFTKKCVENAMKTIGVAADALITPEIIVSWLLEHPDVVTSDTESISKTS